MDQEHPVLEAVVDSEHSGSRLDVVLTSLFPEYSRNQLQESIRQGSITVDGKAMKPRDIVSGGEHILFTPPSEKISDIKPEKIDFDIVDEDEELLIVNKRVGMVVHPAPGNYQGTLLNALLYAYESLASLPRGGIVHRLDKDTSGLMVIAKTPKAYKSLTEQLQARSVRRDYFALVWKRVTTGATIDKPIGRHPRHRKRMAVVEGGRHAVTHYRINRRFHTHTALDVSLETGRTHQIRVHLYDAGYPIVGDAEYGGQFRSIAGWSQEGLEQLAQFSRQALHAKHLALIHPATGENCEWDAPLPEDMQQLLSLIEREDAKA